MSRGVRLEPDLADDDAARAHDERSRQVGQVPVDVGILLAVARRRGEHRGAHAGRRTRGGTGLRWSGVAAGGAHRPGSYCQMT